MFKKSEIDIKKETSAPVKNFEAIGSFPERPVVARSTNFTAATAKVEEEQPETILSEDIAFKGELAFQRFLRIDGQFEGTLISQGKLHVGPKANVKSNLNLQEVIIEGKVEGNIVLQGRLELKSTAQVFGDIQTKSIKVEEGAIIVGIMSVNPPQQH